MAFAVRYYKCSRWVYKGDAWPSELDPGAHASSRRGIHSDRLESIGGEHRGTPSTRSSCSEPVSCIQMIRVEAHSQPEAARVAAGSWVKLPVLSLLAIFDLVLTTLMYPKTPPCHDETEEQRSKDKKRQPAYVEVWLCGVGIAGHRGWRGKGGGRSHGCGGIERRFGMVKAAILEALGKSFPRRGRGYVHF